MDFENVTLFLLTVRNFLIEIISNLGFLEWGWVLILSLVVLSFWVLRSRRTSCIKVFKSSSGEITVTKKAFQELVYNTAINICGVVWTKTKVNQTRKGLVILVLLKIESTKNLTDITEKLQTKLTDLVTIKLGIEKIESMNVHVTGIKPKDPQELHASNSDSLR